MHVGGALQAPAASTALTTAVALRTRGLDLGFNVQWFRGGLVFKAHRRLNHSTPGLRELKETKVSGFRGQELEIWV